VEDLGRGRDWHQMVFQNKKVFSCNNITEDENHGRDSIIKDIMGIMDVNSNFPLGEDHKAQTHIF